MANSSPIASASASASVHTTWPHSKVQAPPMYITKIKIHSPYHAYHPTMYSRACGPGLHPHSTQLSDNFVPCQVLWALVASTLGPIIILTHVWRSARSQPSANPGACLRLIPSLHDHCTILWGSSNWGPPQPKVSTRSRRTSRRCKYDASKTHPLFSPTLY